MQDDEASVRASEEEDPLRVQEVREPLEALLRRLVRVRHVQRALQAGETVDRVLG